MLRASLCCVILSSVLGKDDGFDYSSSDDAAQNALWSAEKDFDPAAPSSVRAPRDAGPDTNAEKCLAFMSAASGEKLSIQDVWAPGALSDEGVVFVMLNGANQGVKLPYKAGCLGTIADEGARLLGASRVDQALPKGLYSPLGQCVYGDSDVTEGAERMVHVLLDQEKWVWPGVAVGHTWWTVSAAPTFATVSRRISALRARSGGRGDAYHLHESEGGAAAAHAHGRAVRRGSGQRQGPHVHVPGEAPRP
jgi:hypothetical protein